MRWCLFSCPWTSIVHWTTPIEVFCLWILILVFVKDINFKSQVFILRHLCVLSEKYFSKPRNPQTIICCQCKESFHRACLLPGTFNAEDLVPMKKNNEIISVKCSICSSSTPATKKRAAAKIPAKLSTKRVRTQPETDQVQSEPRTKKRAVLPRSRLLAIFVKTNPIDCLQRFDLLFPKIAKIPSSVYKAKLAITWYRLHCWTLLGSSCQRWPNIPISGGSPSHLFVSPFIWTLTSNNF